MRDHCIGSVMVKAGVLLLLAGSLFGCAPPPTEPDPFDVFPEKFREEALNHEKLGRYPEALLSWKVVVGLRPDDSEAAWRLLRLQARLQKDAANNFQRGIDFFKQNRKEEARDAFLRTLYLDNFHIQALNYLKNRLTPAHLTVLTAKPGDTLRGIAATRYRDAEKVFLLAEFNAFDPDSPLTPGTEIRMPVLETLKTSEKTSRFPMSLSYPEEKARPPKIQVKARPTKKEVKNSAPFSDAKPKAVAGTPERQKAKSVIDGLIYNKGKRLLGAKKYQQAFDVLAKVDDGYKDVRQIKVFLKRYLNREAEKHYSRGIEYFSAEEFPQAIAQWRRTLSLNPDHRKALNGLERAKKLQNKLGIRHK
jgi:tetratricopeptide (TPR) repeat protein